MRSAQPSTKLRRRRGRLDENGFRIWGVGLRVCSELGSWDGREIYAASNFDFLAARPMKAEEAQELAQKLQSEAWTDPSPQIKGLGFRI